MKYLIKKMLGLVLIGSVLAIIRFAYVTSHLYSDWIAGCMLVTLVIGLLILPIVMVYFSID